MFTGIIEQTGTLIDLTSRGGVQRITVEAPGLAGRLGDAEVTRGHRLRAAGFRKEGPSWRAVVSL